MFRWLVLIAIEVIVIVVGLGELLSITPHPAPPIRSQQFPAKEVYRFTGPDKESCARWRVCGTDLGIPFTLENGSVGYLFGDTHEVADPLMQVGFQGWRSPVMLRSDVTPEPDEPIVFDSAAGMTGDGMAPSLISNDGGVTIIPTDGISFPETGDEIVSYQSIRSWNDTGTQNWQTNHAGLAFSHDGNDFIPMGPIWRNTSANDDPFQMWSMQRDGDYVYIVTVRAGRQEGPMMLLRVPWDKMLDLDAYECLDGERWNHTCRPMFTSQGEWMNGRYGEPSLRLLSDGTWVLSYLDVDTSQIVTRTTSHPGDAWNAPKVQVTWKQFPFLYGGFIHPRSTKSDLMLMVSAWVTQPSGQSSRYDVTYFHGSL